MNISKKELNDLVDELFSNLSDVDFDEVAQQNFFRSHTSIVNLPNFQINKYDIIPELFRTKQKTTRNDSAHELNRSNVQSDLNYSFQPSEISTPVSSKEKSLHSNLSTTTIPNDSTTSILSNLTSTQSTMLDSSIQTPAVVPIDNNILNPIQGASFINGFIHLPQYQQILIQIPTIDILKIQTQQQYPNLSRVGPSLDGFVVGQSSRYQQKIFQHLKTDLPVVMVMSFARLFSIIPWFHSFFLKMFPGI